MKPFFAPANCSLRESSARLPARIAAGGILAVAMLLGGALPSSVFAADAAAGLQRCASITDNSARLACYDELAQQAATENAAAVAKPAVAAMPKPVPATAAVPQTVPQPGPKAVPQQVPQAEPGALPRVAAAEPGREHLGPMKDDEEEPGDFPATLVAVGESSLGGRLFQFESGQVWRQVDKRYVAVPDELPVPAVISRGTFNSYTLRINDAGRSIKVRRVQ